MKQLIVLIFFVSSTLTLSGQKVLVNEPEAVTRLMNNYLQQSKKKNTVEGWRIQIITTGDRRKSETARDKFRSMYPNTHLKWIHESPYYKVKVGGWNRKLDMQIFLQELKSHFPLAIPVVDKIREETLLLP